MSYLLHLEIIEKIIFLTFFIALIVQIFYYFFFYLRIAFHKEKESTPVEKRPVSVIVCAKNEARYLKEFLPALLTQDYPDYEVIVVNDGSTDDTEDVLKILKGEYSRLYVTTIPSTGKLKHTKKLAVSIGLKAAKSDWVILIDADCKVSSPRWLGLLQEKFTENTSFVLGYGAYMSRIGFLNKLIRFDTLFIAMQYFTFSMTGLPYMGVGRNLSYRKELFFKNKGFTRHLHLASGDDDLFVNDNATKANVKISLHPETFTYSVPEEKFKPWFYQKKRHLTTARYYKIKYKLVLGLEILSRLMVYAGLIAGAFFPKIILILTAGFFVRYLIQLVTFYYASVKLKEKGVFYLGIIFDFILPIINFIVHLSNIKFRRRRK
ncbi:MAG: glycosyltransferase [Bacteroidales bacterium]